MAHRNPGISRYQADYLFVEVGRRKKKHLAKHPNAPIISLGIGDTTEPLPSIIVEAFTEKSKKLGTREGYTGYGAPFGDPLLREAIAEKVYASHIDAEDIFISDGAKCDLGRLQFLFGAENSLAIQDPSYPVYVAASVMSGKTEEYHKDSGQYGKIAYLHCNPQNMFFPKTSELPPADLIYVCSPNNPTGAVLNRQQLKELVDLARKQQSLIIFDAAYSGFIRNPAIPRSIFEIDGASDVAIEMGSFSKLAGFTGVRLGWTVVPAGLKYHDGSSVQKDWRQIASTFFNGASNLAQAGGLAALTDEGLVYSEQLCRFYLENAEILKKAVESRGFSCYGGENAPYLWVDINGQNSWDFFDRILRTAHVVTTPGVGFGPAGEGFLRLSAFGRREQIIEASQRLQKNL